MNKPRGVERVRDTTDRVGVSLVRKENKKNPISFDPKLFYNINETACIKQIAILTMINLS